MRFAIPLLASSLVFSGTAFASGTAAAAHPAHICLDISNINGTTILSDNEILFRLVNGKMLKNTLRGTCHGLKFEGGFAWEIWGDEVCSNMQPIYVLHRGTPCFLGDFTPYEKPAKPATAS